MTWPFENDTSAIVKKLADRSMKADKRRNAFIIITIAFAVSLMMVLALYNLGTDRENRLYLQGRYQGSFINSTSTVFEKLEHNNQIEAVGKEAAMGTSRINDYTLDVYYRDQNALELKGVTDLLGKMPEAEGAAARCDDAAHHAAYILYQNGKRGHEPQGIAVHHGTRQHCNDAELLRPRYFPFRTGGNGTAASQGKNHRRGQAGACGGKRRGNQGGISSTQNLLLLLLLLRAKT